MNISETTDKFLVAIKEGLQNDEFKMYLQLIVDNKTKNITSAEALSRWETADNGLIFPGKYVGVMEEAGLITTLDYLMFEKVCRKLSEWEGTELDNVTISCNFTRITISEADFVTKIKEISDRYVFDHRKLIMEITEDSIEKNFNMAKSNLVSAVIHRCEISVIIRSILSNLIAQCFCLPIRNVEKNCSMVLSRSCICWI